ncbi:thiol reductant ABC exporter subunit CydC [Planotetraspora sp. A-T 1434]|uniref:thiol reductant ABC exporter subunit CydC n=1 Tax=Planotetraspora sp. A-T 1434 TaxID=2979219 RepID=UPI0021C10F8E|nr:thiol reductant ABC exporter subunit CydC [Planotetraspora sp. A-T 1434]MCT9933393.1 thiol reductant ABC exporter subunit CydC [Planotetraspora sp. A-T 1434]
MTATLLGPGMTRRLALAALAGSAADLAGVALIASAAWLITRAAEQPPLAALSVAIVAVRAFATTRGIFRYGERLAGHDVALRAQAGTRERLYQALIPTGPLSHRGADLLSRMVDDTDAVQDLLVRCVLPAVAALLTGIAAVVVAAFLLPAAALALAAGLLVAGALLPAGTTAAARRWSARIAPARAELAAKVADLVHGAADLAAYGARDQALAAGMDADARLAKLERGQARINAAGLGLGVLAQGLTVVAVVLTAQAAHLGTVATAVLALTALVSFEPVLPLAAAGERFAGVLAALRRLREIRATPPAVAEPDSPAPPPEPPLTVEVDNLVVRHRDREPALDGVSLTLTPGKRVAIVGPSGAGKSTLLSALMRTVGIESGNIRINGVDVRAYSSDDVRARMTGLTQDPYVFQATVRDNLRLAGPDASEDDLAHAVRQARLDAWAERTGWDTTLGEDGRTVSGGQLQRLALARALLFDPSVLLLDEPAEALDEETADLLMADLLDATRGRTTLLVTHRLRGLEQVDEIVVLENGRVAQRGTHAELLAVPGYYRDLWESEAMTGH